MHRWDARLTDDDALAEELAPDDALPEDERVLKTVHVPILLERLVEAVDRREEEQRVRVLEERHPCGALSNASVWVGGGRERYVRLSAHRRRRR